MTFVPLEICIAIAVLFFGFGACFSLLLDLLLWLIAKRKKQRNYDRIRNMSVDELADFTQECGWDFPPYCDYQTAQECDHNCIKCAKQWLESEVDCE
jgi:hypothetical protein